MKYIATTLLLLSVFAFSSCKKCVKCKVSQDTKFESYDIEKVCEGSELYDYQKEHPGVLFRDNNGWYNCN